MVDGSLELHLPVMYLSASGVAVLVGFRPEMVPARVSLTGTMVAEWPPPSIGGGRPGPS
jgi:hypothetical protein